MQTNSLEPTDRDFKEACDKVKSYKNVDTEKQLKLYGLFKRVEVGVCNSPKPGMLDFVGKSKWNSWKSFDDVSTQEAKKRYVELVQKLGQDQDENKKQGKDVLASANVHVSSMYSNEQAKDIRSFEEDNIYDLIAFKDSEKAIKMINQFDRASMLQRNADDATILHYAVDRELLDVVKVILSRPEGKELKLMKDSDNYTPRDYATIVENEAILDII